MFELVKTLICLTCILKYFGTFILYEPVIIFQGFMWRHCSVIPYFTYDSREPGAIDFAYFLLSRLPSYIYRPKFNIIGDQSIIEL